MGKYSLSLFSLQLYCERSEAIQNSATLDCFVASLLAQLDGSLKFIPHPYLQHPYLDKPFQGIMLPDGVKENLLATDNAGCVVELDPNTSGEKVPALVSIDKLTNRLEAVSLDKLTVFQDLKGVELSSEQQR